MGVVGQGDRARFPHYADELALDIAHMAFGEVIVAGNDDHQPVEEILVLEAGVIAQPGCIASASRDSRFPIRYRQIRH
jgi:hypothetical protein